MRGKVVSSSRGEWASSFPAWGVVRQGEPLAQGVPHFRRRIIIRAVEAHGLSRQTKEAVQTSEDRFRILILFAADIAPCVLDRRVAANRLTNSEQVNDERIKLLTSALKTETNEEVAGVIIRALGALKREDMRSTFREEVARREPGRRSPALDALFLSIRRLSSLLPHKSSASAAKLCPPGKGHFPPISPHRPLIGAAIFVWQPRRFAKRYEI